VPAMNEPSEKSNLDQPSAEDRAPNAEVLVEALIRSERQSGFADRSREFAASARDSAIQALSTTWKRTGRALRSAQDAIAQQAAFDELNEALEHATEILAIQHARISSLEERLDRLESGSPDA
jgi:hypothetical protein